jgi:hypothetical protein
MTLHIGTILLWVLLPLLLRVGTLQQWWKDPVFTVLLLHIVVYFRAGWVALSSSSLDGSSLSVCVEDCCWNPKTSWDSIEERRLVCFLADDGDVEVGGSCEISKWTLWHWVLKEFGALVTKHHQKALD